MYTYYIIGLFLLFNLISFIMMGIDKSKAVHQKFRIKEQTLMISALPFASFGFYYSMKFFKHKTQKKKFIIYGRLLIIIHTLLLIFCFLNYTEIGQLMMHL